MCSSYKGILPSDLIEKYNGFGGWRRMEFDLSTLGEIHDQIKEAHGTDNKGANMESRKKQRRSQRAAEMDGADTLQLLKDGGFIREDKE
jgi:hypothetical protein|tara:strand:+ start:557 stop:823 length:267 start_codon:yes stop_codon:yes gene_type:complete